MKRLLCSWFGHKWQPFHIWFTGDKIGSQEARCVRCDADLWRSTH